MCAVQGLWRRVGRVVASRHLRRPQVRPPPSAQVVERRPGPGRGLWWLAQSVRRGQPTSRRLVQSASRGGGEGGAAKGRWICAAVGLADSRRASRGAAPATGRQTRWRCDDDPRWSDCGAAGTPRNFLPEASARGRKWARAAAAAASPLCRSSPDVRIDAALPSRHHHNEQRRATYSVRPDTADVLSESLRLLPEARQVPESGPGAPSDTSACLPASQRPVWCTTLRDRRTTATKTQTKRGACRAWLRWGCRRLRTPLTASPRSSPSFWRNNVQRHGVRRVCVVSLMCSGPVPAGRRAVWYVVS